jgi:hypothetical protein
MPLAGYCGRRLALEKTHKKFGNWTAPLRAWASSNDAPTFKAL